MNRKMKRHRRQSEREKSMYAYVKRGMDFILALLGLIVLSPVFLILIAAIKLDSPGPVLFRQKRVGIHKTHFAILKEH